MQVKSERLTLEPFAVGGKPTAIIDMDGVTCQFVPAVCAEVNKRTGGNLTPEDVTDWDMSKFGIEITDWQKPGFFRSLEPMPGAIETLYKMQRDYHLAIATDCMGVDFVRAEKAEWLKEYLPFITEVHYTGDKSKVKGDLLFDDAPHHLAVFPGVTFKMLTPYNLHAPTDFEVENWEDFYGLLKHLERWV
jgi:5'-nucleotidase